MKKGLFDFVSRAVFLFLVLLFLSCNKEHLFDCFKSAGSTTTETRILKPFNVIELKKNVELIITPNSGEYKAEVSAGENLIESITTTVKNDSVLVITNENRCNWVRSFKNKFIVHVFTPSLKILTVSGTRDVSMTDTLVANDFTLNVWSATGKISLLLKCGTATLAQHTGTADVEAKGDAGVLYLYKGNTGYADCSGLSTGYSYVTNLSSNNMHVLVTKELGAIIEYTGNVYYRGNPYKISQAGKGSGKLIKE